MPATTQKNLYDILGVSKDAPKDEIRKAYLKLAKKYHPDKTGGDKAAEERLKEINAAYGVMKNEEKRKEYDATLNNPFGHGNGPASGSAGGFDPGGFSFSFEGGGLGDILEGLFSGFGSAGHGHTRHTAQPGRDLEVALNVSLREAASGVNKTVRLNRKSPCGTCHGTGATDGAQPQVCPDCQGRGQTQRGGGAIFMSQTCARCHGKGHVITNPCAPCHGQGHVRTPHTVTVTIPAGVHTGTRLRLQGQGDAGQHGAPAGDLYVSVHVAPDPTFKREGDHLHCDVAVPFTTAALGGTVRVTTLTGQAQLRIPAGTQSGKVFRLRGQGMPNAHGAKGDLLATIQITVPEHITPEQRALLEQLAKTL